MELIKKLGGYGPLLFGIGFIAPLVAQSLDAASLAAPLGLSNIAFGLAVGVSLGTIARLRGTWL